MGLEYFTLNESVGVKFANSSVVPRRPSEVMGLNRIEKNKTCMHI